METNPVFASNVTDSIRTTADTIANNTSAVLGMGALEITLIALAIIIVALVLYYQIKSFKETREKIYQLRDFFPNESSLELIQSSITKDVLQSKAKLEDFINNPPKRHVVEILSNLDVEDDEDLDEELESDNQDEQIEYSDVDLIKIKNNAGSDAYKEVVKETNAYLCKNVGTSADFSIIQEICERKIDTLEAQISNTVNVPLYLGLAGTFIGIITGLAGIAFNVDVLFNGGNMSPLRNLLVGVVIAMIASFVGLFLMIRNSSVNYKQALSHCEQNKNGYYDFIRRELMPVLSNSMASSLNSLKGVLGEFIGKFGHNLDAYANSAELLNDNIEKQHLLLVEINRMDQTRMASQIATTFNTLKESSESLDAFHGYQESLNQTIEQVNTAVSKIDTVVDTFGDFGRALKVVVENQETAGILQEQFRSAIETHFPTGSEAREMWRKQFDELTEDAKKVSGELNEQLKASTEHIQSFVQSNEEAFNSMSNLKEVLDSLVQYASVQASCYKDLKEEIKNLKESQAKSQSESAKLNSDLLIAVREMITTLKNSKN